MSETKSTSWADDEREGEIVAKVEEDEREEKIATEVKEDEEVDEDTVKDAETLDDETVEPPIIEVEIGEKSKDKRLEKEEEENGEEVQKMNDEVEEEEWKAGTGFNDERRKSDQKSGSGTPPTQRSSLAQRQEMARQLERELARKHAEMAKSQTPTSLTTRNRSSPATMNTTSIVKELPMQDVHLQFMDISGSLKPGGSSSVIAEPTYYRARSASNSARKPGRRWRYFNAEESKLLDRSKTEPVIRTRRQKPKNLLFNPTATMDHSSGEDLDKQVSLSNKLLNVMTIDDYQERYYGRRVKTANKYGHRISRTDSPMEDETVDHARNSARTDSRPNSTKRPTSSKCESGIFEECDIEIEDKQSKKESSKPSKPMPLEYFAMVDQVDGENAIVKRGFEILLNSNECVHNTSSKLYREKSAPNLNRSGGSEFFRRLTTTLRYQLLVGEGLPSKSRYRKAARMHASEDEVQVT